MGTFLHKWELLIAVLVISILSGKIKTLKYKAEWFRERIMIISVQYVSHIYLRILIHLVNIDNQS